MMFTSNKKTLASAISVANGTCSSIISASVIDVFHLLNYNS
jgi:hypothetical protein